MQKFFKRSLTFLLAVFAGLAAHANTVRVQKIGANGRAIVSFAQAPEVAEGDRITLKSTDEEMEEFSDEIRIEIVKLKGTRAIVRFPSSRGIRVGESFEVATPKRKASRPKRRQLEEGEQDDNIDEARSSGKNPFRFGAELGWAYGKDMGGIEAGTTDYGSSYTWMNFLLGGVFRYEIPKMPFGIQSGLYYARRTYNYSLSTTNTEIKLKYATNNIEIPLIALYKLEMSPGMALVPGMGLNVRYGVGSVSRNSKVTVSGTETTESASISYDDAGIARMAYELVVKLGLDMDISKSVTAFGDFKIHWGINDRNTVEGGKSKKDLSFNLSGGVLF